jgi:hypothetical protein
VTAPGRQPAHVPATVVAALSTALRPVRPSLARALRQTLDLERLPLRVDPGPGHEAYPWLPHTPIRRPVPA